MQVVPSHDSVYFNMGFLFPQPMYSTSLSKAAQEELALRELIMGVTPILDTLGVSLNIRRTLFGNNKGTECLAKFPSNRFRAKHIVVEYYHFRSVVLKGYFLVKRGDIIEQLDDIFNKPLTKIPLEYLQKQMMGWPIRLSHGNSNVERFQSYMACAT